MKAPSEFSAEMVDMYNLFVTCASKYHLLFDELSVDIGLSEFNNLPALQFNAEISGGLTKFQAEKVFEQLIKRYPQCGINYNIKEVSAFEERLGEVATVIYVTEGRTLEYMDNIT